MKIVIDIPNKDYQVTLTKIMLACHGCKITELPKNHGDLIDRNELLNCSYEIDGAYTYEEVVHIDDVRQAPTIIEAEVGSDNN